MGLEDLTNGRNHYTIITSQGERKTYFRAHCIGISGVRLRHDYFQPIKEHSCTQRVCPDCHNEYLDQIRKGYRSGI